MCSLVPSLYGATERAFVFPRKVKVRGDIMSSRRVRAKAIIEIEGGRIYVDGLKFDAEFRYPYWLLKVNQNAILPGLRRDQRRVIYVNGKRFGKADYRMGCIPLASYRVPEEYWSDKLTNFVRETFGLGCPRQSRGYYNIQLKTGTYIVVARKTSQGYHRCLAYRKDTEEYIGDFLFDPKLETVYPRLQVSRLERTFYILIGYMMDNLAYATVASQLSRKMIIR